MNEKRTLKVLSSSGDVDLVTVEIMPPDSLKMVVNGAGFTNATFEGYDLFESMNSLRNSLENTGRKLLCNGARVDVYPSGMSRSMGAGRIVYIQRLGELAVDKLDIFDEADPSLVGTVNEQSEFRQKWLESLVKQSANPEAVKQTDSKMNWVYLLAAIFFLLLMFAVPVSFEEVSKGQDRIMILKDMWGYILIGISYLGFLMLIARRKWLIFCIIIVLPVLLFAQTEHYSREWRPLELHYETDGTLHCKIGRSLSLFSSEEVQTQVVYQGWFYDEYEMTGPIYSD